MVLVRILVYHCMTINLKLTAKWIDTKSNEIADSLSRFQDKKFCLLKAGMNMNSKPTQVPSEIWPPQDIWLE